MRHFFTLCLFRLGSRRFASRRSPRPLIRIKYLHFRDSKLLAARGLPTLAYLLLVVYPSRQIDAVRRSAVRRDYVGVVILGRAYDRNPVERGDELGGGR